MNTNRIKFIPILSTLFKNGYIKLIHILNIHCKQYDLFETTQQLNPGKCVIHNNYIKIHKITNMIKFGYNPTHFNDNNQLINIYNTFKQNNSIYFIELLYQIIDHIEILFMDHIGHSNKTKPELVLYDHNIFTIVGTFLLGNDFISLSNFKNKKNKKKIKKK
jgi:hypothetical protein